MDKIDIIMSVKDKYKKLSKKEINDIINIIFDKLSTLEVGDSFTQNNFGRFDGVIRAKRKGRHILTGETIIIPEAQTIKFSISKTKFNKINHKGDNK